MSLEKEKILHLAKYYYPSHGGIETATKDLAEAAAKLGLEVKCHAIGQCSREESYWHGGVQVRSFPQRGKFFSAPLSPALFFRRIDDSSVVHVHLPNPMMEIRVLFSLWRSARSRRRIFPFFHAFPVGQGLLGRFWFRFITAPILRRASSILVSNSHQLRSFPVLAEWKEKLVVMPFVADPLSVEELERLKAERLNAKIVLAVGRMVPYKGFDILLKAWKLIENNPQFCSFRLRLIGSGPEESKWKQLASDLGLARVEFLGSVSEESKWAALQSACLLVAPSLTKAETFGISVLEAMSYGLPVVTTNLDTGLSTLARAGACGGIAEPGNVEQLTENICRLLGDPKAALEHYGKENLSFVQANHSRTHLSERYSDFLKARIRN
jgi:glycosyltransferase involved in cell wall biosynthesis